jgi:phage baseplate assembly protein W
MANITSRAFSDISLSFSKNPITNDLIALKNEDAIKKSVINLVKTQIGERFYNNLLGSSVTTSLFELNSRGDLIFLEEQIKNLLNNYEPRIVVQNVFLDIPDDSNELYLQIQYVIVGLPVPTQTIDVILQSTRA